MSDQTGGPGVPEPTSRAITAEDRLDRLAQIVSRRTLEGYSVIDRDDRRVTAVLMKPGKPVNHVLHAIITLFTCGIWALVWIILSTTKQKEQRLRVTIDTTGSLIEERVSTE